MKSDKNTPKTKNESKDTKSASGKKLIQARLPFQILSQSSKTPQTSTSTNSTSSTSVDSVENTDIRKRKLSYSSDSDAVSTKILKTIPRENVHEKVEEIIIVASDDSDENSNILIDSESAKSKLSSEQLKLNNKLIIKLPICSKKKRKKLKSNAQSSPNNSEHETSLESSENPLKKLKSEENSIHIEKKSIDLEVQNDVKSKTMRKTSELDEEVVSLLKNEPVYDIKDPDKAVDVTVDELNKTEVIEFENKTSDIFEIEENEISFNKDNLSITIAKNPSKALSAKSGKLVEKELQKQKDKEEKERQKRLEKEEKEEQRRKEKEERKRERDEKEEAKRKEKEEKEQKRLAEIESRNEEKRLKEDERKKKEEQKEEERKKREDEKRKKEIEKEEAEFKKKKAAEAFTKFFVQSKSNQKPLDDEQNSSDSFKSEQRAFMPFEIKGDMTLAPIIRKNLASEDKKNLINFLNNGNEMAKKNLYLKVLNSSNYKPSISPRTLPKDNEDINEVIIIDNELQQVGQPIDVTTKLRTKYRAKYFLFHENRRPPYHGTWRKHSSVITPRKPFNIDKAVFDYEIDSDDEWEEEEAGESLRGSEDEKESEDEYEVDNDFFVPHGHLSDEELQNDDEMEEINTPQNQKAKLKILQQEFAQEMKKKTEKLKPKLYGIFWADEDGNQSKLCPDVIWNSLNKRSMIFTEPFSLQFDSVDEAGTSPKQAEKKIMRKTEFPEQYIIELIKLTHGNRNKKEFIIREFLAHIKQKLEIGNEKCTIEYTKKSIKDKIDEIASWKPYIDKNQSKKKILCWVISLEVLEKYGLTDLDILNEWSYILTPKLKREGENRVPDPENNIQKPQKNTELTIKKFAKSSKDIINNLNLIGAEDNKPKSLELVKKRVQLLSSPLFKSKSSESKIVSTSNFLKTEIDSAKYNKSKISEANAEPIYIDKI